MCVCVCVCVCVHACVCVTNYDSGPLEVGGATIFVCCVAAYDFAMGTRYV